MNKLILSIGAGIMLLLSSATGADATNCSAYTYTFSNGTTADATQVNSNFNTIMNCANINLAPIASPSFTGSVGIGTTNTALLSIGTLSVESGSASGVNTGLILNSAHGYGTGVGTAASALTFSRNRTGDTPIAPMSQIAGGNENEATGSYGYVAFLTLNSSLIERMRITSAGNVGIATNAPSYTLHVNGSVAGTSAYNNLSDARLKKNVNEISDGLGLIEKLRGVRFRWRQPNERSVGKDLNLPVGDPQVGLIAQEVQGVLPEAVTKSKDGIFSIQESKIVPVLVQAVKQQQSEIQALKHSNEDQAAEIKGLRQQIADFEARLSRVEIVARMTSRRQASTRLWATQRNIVNNSSN
jgi:hypothetical protein